MFIHMIYLQGGVYKALGRSTAGWESPRSPAESGPVHTALPESLAVWQSQSGSSRTSHVWSCCSSCSLQTRRYIMLFPDILTQPEQVFNQIYTEEREKKSYYFTLMYKVCRKKYLTLNFPTHSSDARVVPLCIMEEDSLMCMPELFLPIRVVHAWIVSPHSSSACLNCFSPFEYDSCCLMGADWSALIHVCRIFHFSHDDWMNWAKILHQILSKSWWFSKQNNS